MIIFLNISIGRMIGIITALVWLIYKFSNTSVRFSTSHFFAFLFLVWAVFSTLWTNSISETIPYILRLFVGVGSFLIIVDILNNEYRVNLSLQAFVVGSFITATRINYELFQYFFFPSRDWAIERVYISGFNINRAAGIVLLSIPVAIYIIFKSRNRYVQLCNSIIILSSVLSIFASGSRQTIVAIPLLAITAMYMISTKYEIPYYRLTIGLSTLFTLVIILMWHISYRMIERAVQILVLIKNADVGARGEIWIEALKIGFENLLLGVGAGAFPTVSWNGTHNTFLGVFADLGIIGLILFLPVLFNTFIKNISIPPKSNSSVLSLLIIVAIFPILVFNNWEFEPTLWIILAFSSATRTVES